jgi:hypothetical protein
MFTSLLQAIRPPQLEATPSAFITRRPTASSWREETYSNDMLSRRFLIPIIEEAKFNPYVHRCHCVKAGDKVTAEQGLIPTELASYHRYCHWQASVSATLFRASLEDDSLHSKKLTETWLDLFTEVAARADCIPELRGRAWIECVNGLLSAFYTYSTSGASSHLIIDWRKVDEAMRLYISPSSSSSGGKSKGFTGKSSNNQGSAKPAGPVRWEADWLKRNGFFRANASFFCGDCEEYGFWPPQCPCKKNFTPASSKKRQAGDGDKAVEKKGG